MESCCLVCPNLQFSIRVFLEEFCSLLRAVALHLLIRDKIVPAYPAHLIVQKAQLLRLIHKSPQWPISSWRKLYELESWEYESGDPREATAAAPAAAGAGAAISFAAGEGQDGEGTRSPNPSSEGLQAPPG
jgi:hypothetical protein